MKINRFLALAAITLLMFGAMGLGMFSYRALAQTVQQPTSPATTLNGNATSKIEDKGDKADEVAPANATITAVQAQAIAEKANPGVATLAVEFDREGGKDIWEIELANGLDVQVDAGRGDILLTEVRDQN